MPRESKTLTDAAAKDILRGWPSHTTSLFGGSAEEPWIQAQPPNGHATTPCIMNAGSTTLTTRPDGMWIRIHPGRDAADVFCVDVCGSLQNLHDKRSRFLPATSALVLKCEKKWLNEAIYTTKPRWQKTGVFESTSDNDWFFPIRYLRVLFCLPEQAYAEFMRNGIAAGHEYFMKHSSLGSFGSAKMQEFLKSISPRRHFYTAK